MIVALYLRIIAALCVAYVGFALGRKIERADQSRRRERREAGRLLAGMRR